MQNTTLIIRTTKVRKSLLGTTFAARVCPKKDPLHPHNSAQETNLYNTNLLQY